MFQELQSLSEARKKQVIIISTIVIMAIVIGIWVTYFNSIIVGSSGQAEQQASSSIAIAPAAAPAQARGPGLWQDIKNIFGSIANIFRSPSQYNIKPN